MPGSPTTTWDVADGYYHQIVKVELQPSYWVQNGNTYAAVRDKQEQDLFFWNNAGTAKTVDVVFLLSFEDSPGADGNLPSVELSVAGSFENWGADELPEIADEPCKYWPLLTSELTSDIETLPNISVQSLECDQEGGTDLRLNAWQSRPKLAYEHDVEYTGELGNYIEYAERYTASSRMYQSRRPASSWMMMALCDTMNCIAYYGLNGLATTVMTYQHWAPE